MPIISKMNINGDPYDLAGRGNMSYIAGDGITIDANGRISVDLGSEGVTPAQLEALRQDLSNTKVTLTGALNTLTGRVDNGAMIMTYMDSEIAGIKASA